jgi:hypothetical protein
MKPLVCIRGVPGSNIIRGITVIVGVFRGVSQSIQTRDEVVLLSGHDCLLPADSAFFIPDAVYFELKAAS